MEEMELFQSKVKPQGIWVVPILVLIILLLIPQVHWIIALGMTTLIVFVRLASLTKVLIANNSIIVLYPFNPLKRGYSYKLNNIKEIVYVDRKGATKGTETHSHLNIHYKVTNRVHRIKHILNRPEYRTLKSLLQKSAIKFRYTTEVKAHEL